MPSSWLFPTSSPRRWSGPGRSFLPPSSECEHEHEHESIQYSYCQTSESTSLPSLDLILTRPRRTYSSSEELLANPEVEAVLIATETAKHADLAIKSIRAGKASTGTQLPSSLVPLRVPQTFCRIVSGLTLVALPDREAHLAGRRRVEAGRCRGEAAPGAEGYGGVLQAM
jgi:hypothetical protein